MEPIKASLEFKLIPKWFTIYSNRVVTLGFDYGITISKMDDTTEFLNQITVQVNKYFEQNHNIKDFIQSSDFSVDDQIVECSLSKFMNERELDNLNLNLRIYNI